MSCIGVCCLFIAILSLEVCRQICYLFCLSDNALIGLGFGLLVYKEKFICNLLSALH